MSWAVDRKTTRIEDRAYSLIGLFDINMTLLYGEGSRAFFRLQEELIRSKADHSILAFESKGNGSVFAQSPLEFKFSGGFMAPDNDPDPYRMTNRGLEIELDVGTELDVGIWHDGSRHVALLECFDRDGNQIAIYIARRAGFSDSKVGTAVFRTAMGIDETDCISLDRVAREEIEQSGPIQRRKLLIARSWGLSWS